MTVELPSGPLDNNTWAKIQAAILKRDDAENFPAILMYPHENIDPEDVEAELDMLRHVLGKCPYTLARDQVKLKSGEPAFFQKSESMPKPKVYPGGKYCDVPGHCFPTPQGLANHVRATHHPVPKDFEIRDPFLNAHVKGVPHNLKEEEFEPIPADYKTEAGYKPDVERLLNMKSSYDYSYDDWQFSDFDKGKNDVLAIISMGSQNWIDQFTELVESGKYNTAEDVFNGRVQMWFDRVQEMKHVKSLKKLHELHDQFPWEAVHARIRQSIDDIPKIVSNFERDFAIELENESEYENPFDQVSKAVQDTNFTEMKTALDAWKGASTNHRTSKLWLWASAKYSNTHIPSFVVHEEMPDETDLFELEASSIIQQQLVRAIDPTYDRETDTVMLYRGVTYGLATKIREALKDPEMQRIVIEHRCLESWSASPDSARNFGMVIINTRVPVTSIVAVGYGSSDLLNSNTEMEYIVATPNGEAHYIRDDFKDFSREEHSRYNSEEYNALIEANRQFREAPKELWRSRVTALMEKAGAHFHQKRAEEIAAFHGNQFNIHPNWKRAVTTELGELKDSFHYVYEVGHDLVKNVRDSIRDKPIHEATMGFMEAVGRLAQTGELESKNVKKLFITNMKNVNGLNHYDQDEVKRQAKEIADVVVNRLRKAGVDIKESPPPPPLLTFEELPLHINFASHKLTSLLNQSREEYEDDGGEVDYYTSQGIKYAITELRYKGNTDGWVDKETAVDMIIRGATRNAGSKTAEAEQFAMKFLSDFIRTTGQDKPGFSDHIPLDTYGGWTFEFNRDLHAALDSYHNTPGFDEYMYNTLNHHCLNNVMAMVDKEISKHGTPIVHKGPFVDMMKEQLGEWLPRSIPPEEKNRLAEVVYERFVSSMRQQKYKGDRQYARRV